jgi:hypothetical protein
VEKRDQWGKHTVKLFLSSRYRGSTAFKLLTRKNNSKKTIVIGPKPKNYMPLKSTASPTDPYFPQKFMKLK